MTSFPNSRRILKGSLVLAAGEHHEHVNSITGRHAGDDNAGIGALALQQRRHEPTR